MWMHTEKFIGINGAGFEKHIILLLTGVHDLLFPEKKSLHFYWGAQVLEKSFI